MSYDPQSGQSERPERIKSSYVIAGVIALLVAGYFISGSLDFGNGEETPPPIAERPDEQAIVPRVRARALVAEERAATLMLRGQTEAIRKVEVKAETTGVVSAVPVEKGTRVEAGAVLCELGLDARDAALAQARAGMRKAQLEYEAARKLTRQGFRSETQIASSLADFEAARAEVRRMEVELEHTKISAPFDGIVDDRMVEIGDFMRTGDSCALLIDEEPFLVVAEVAEREVERVSVGDRGMARLITGETAEGNVRFIATSSDPRTRTFRLELEIPNPQRSLRDGVTAELRIATDSVKAHRISPAILSLDDEGRVGVKVLDGDIVRFKTVELVDDGPDGVWVTGLPDRVTVITVGQEFAKDGGRVEAVIEDGGAQS